MFTTTLSWFLWTTKFYTFYFTDHAFSPQPPLPPLFSLKKKTTGTSHKKVFWTKTSACSDGTLKNQANKMGMTRQHFHNIPTSCAILPSMHTTKLSTCTLAYSNPLNKRTSHSLLLTHQPSCIQDICHVQHTRLTVSTMLNAIALQQPTTHLTLHAHQHALHTHEHYPSQCLPPPSYAHKPTQGKMAQDVGMVWKCCGVVPILFAWFLRVPSLHVLVFVQKTFLWLCVMGYVAVKRC